MPKNIEFTQDRLNRKISLENGDIISLVRATGRLVFIVTDHCGEDLEMNYKDQCSLVNLMNGNLSHVLCRNTNEDDIINKVFPKALSGAGLTITKSSECDMNIVTYK